jgi:putative peptide zinc metalloprotease protein
MSIDTHAKPAVAGEGDTPAVESPSGEPVWQRVPGVQALGPFQGSGLVEPSYLVQRGDGQVLHLSELLYVVLQEADPARPSTELAAAVSAATGRGLSVEGLTYLARTRLEPMGLLRDTASATTAAAPSQPRATPVLALSLKAEVIPAPVVRRLARLLACLFWSPLVVAVIAAVVVMDVVLARRASPLAALEQVLATPAFLLLLFGLLTAGALIHECGHAAACAAGGAEPGSIGVGVYLLFPAFYTDVTSSYRLGRAGRIRTDLGGLYFNLWCLLAAGWGYLATGQPVLLLVVVLMHLEMAQQLLPAVRFDGYFVLADLAGVPDLFARIWPVLSSLRPGRPTDPRVAELRPRARRLISGWVFAVIPCLAFGLGWLFWNLPHIVTTSVSAIGAQASDLTAAWDRHDPAAVVLATLAVVLLAVPLLGLAVVLPRLVMAPVRLAVHVNRRAGRRDRPAGTSGPAAPGWPAAITPHPARTAAAFADELMLPVRRRAATRGWRHLVHRVSRGRIALGPGRAERVEQELIARVRCPVEGTRRVVVMSRKGGVGKTTITLTLGATTAALRGDRVVAVDANPDAGNLAHRADERTQRTVTDVLRDLDQIDSYARVRSYTAQTVETPLEVLASDDDARIATALGRNDYHRVLNLLDHFYNLILIDTGTGILDSANQGLLTEADQLVLVLRPALDGGRAAALTLDWLGEHDYGSLVAGAVVVINGTRRGIGMPLGPLVDHFASRCRVVCRVPWDPALEAGGHTALTDLRPATRRALLQLAAAVADGHRARRARTPHLGHLNGLRPDLPHHAGHLADPSSH